ncbi:MAG: prolipoprotein diacylglyceryl transferase, partial [Candidatus Omnitrophota bacterium]
MHPVIVKFGPVTIYSYGLMLVLAFSIATFLVGREGKRQGLNPELFFNLSFLILLSGIVGARLLYVIINLKFYLSHPLQIILLNRGGLAWF